MKCINKEISIKVNQGTLYSLRFIYLSNIQYVTNAKLRYRMYDIIEKTILEKDKYEVVFNFDLNDIKYIDYFKYHNEISNDIVNSFRLDSTVLNFDIISKNNFIEFNYKEFIEFNKISKELNLDSNIDNGIVSLSDKDCKDIIKHCLHKKEYSDFLDKFTKCVTK